MIPLSLGGGSPSPVDPNAAAVLLVTRDLMIESRVAGAAGAAGSRFLSASDPGRALAVDAPRLRLVLVDLQPGMTGLPALVDQFQTSRKIPVVAFGSHVATALLDEARQAGCHEVLPRSRLHAGLDELLRHYALEC
jgi:CheY-like chemotaxis protein